MTYQDFINIVNHKRGGVDLIIRKAFYLDNDYYHSLRRFKEGGEIVSKGELEYYSHCAFIDLRQVDGKLTGLSDYSFFLIIGNDGTTILVQDLLQEKSDEL